LAGSLHAAIDYDMEIAAIKERREIERLLVRLNASKTHEFPPKHQRVGASVKHGVYIIKNKSGRVVHVGRTVSGRGGLAQRLSNHLQGQSSFTNVHLNGNGDRLRQGYKFQFLAIRERRSRALLVHAATAFHCPVHLGVGVKRGT